MIKVVAAPAVAAILAAGCGTGGGSVSAPPLITTTTTAATATSDGGESAPSTTEAPEPEPVEIEQVDCPAGLVAADVACGVAEVPLDRSASGEGATTEITVATVEGTGSDQALPMAVLQGGPGGASSEMAAYFPQRAFTQVFIDQRGTGFVGTDLDCTEFDPIVLDVLAMPSPDGDDLADDALDDCAERLRDDPVLTSADTAAHAADVSDVMTALGYDEWLVYGVSYGTTIALELMRTEPDGLVGAVLDGVYPPDIDTDADVAFSAERALRELDAACSTDPDCSAADTDLVALVDELIERLDDAPVTVELRPTALGTESSVEVVLDGRRLAEFVFVLLYDESQLRYLPSVLTGIDAGDEESATWLARAGSRALVSSQFANDEGTFFSVQCHDRLPFTDGLPDDMAPFPAAVAGVSLAEVCTPWQRAAASPNTAVAVTSELPTLLLSGQFDPITPPVYADRVAAGLGEATTVTQDGRGHGIWFGDECIGSIVREFVAAPAEPVDTSCVAEGVEVDWRGP